MLPFNYPNVSHEYRHGPKGYLRYRSYRPWLRDEFTFRCVYCLAREQWGRVTGEFDLDHFQPQANHPSLPDDYDNLLYSCRVCNQLKMDQHVPDPRAVFTADQVSVQPDGTLEGRSDRARMLIAKLALNSNSYKDWRRLWIEIIELAGESHPHLYLQLMGFPEDLPDLSRLRPPENTRPEGIRESYRVRQQRGELPATY